MISTLYNVYACHTRSNKHGECLNSFRRASSGKSISCERHRIKLNYPQNCFRKHEHTQNICAGEPFGVSRAVLPFEHSKACLLFGRGLAVCLARFCGGAHKTNGQYANSFVHHDSAMALVQFWFEMVWWSVFYAQIDMSSSIPLDTVCTCAH